MHLLIPSAVLKTTGSSFEHFIRDEYATLCPVSDRIFSTCVDLAYTFEEVTVSKPGDEEKLAFEVPTLRGGGGAAWNGGEVAERAREVTLEVFANDESASVQVRGIALRVDALTMVDGLALRPRCTRWRNGWYKRTCTCRA
jgi:hypothetical protein